MPPSRPPRIPRLDSRLLSNRPNTLASKPRSRLPLLELSRAASTARTTAALPVQPRTTSNPTPKSPYYASSSSSSPLVPLILPHTISYNQQCNTRRPISSFHETDPNTGGVTPKRKTAIMAQGKPASIPVPDKPVSPPRKTPAGAKGAKATVPPPRKRRGLSVKEAMAATNPAIKTGSELLSPNKTMLTELLSRGVSRIGQSLSEGGKMDYRSQSVQEKCADEQALFCTAQADYKIDVVKLRLNDDLIPTTTEGEHIGTSDSAWHKHFDLPPTFSTWMFISWLHAYLTLARYRDVASPTRRAHSSHLHSILVDRIFIDIERRLMNTHLVIVESKRQRFLREYFEMWRGSYISYDEAIARGSDAHLATAIWRNVYKGREMVDVRNLFRMVEYVRRVLEKLGKMKDEDVVLGTSTGFQGVLEDMGMNEWVEGETKAEGW